MVSTRGIKFKFSEGEKVLCYEPDPTKAKVLYDSKVLELNVNRDARGRKVPEYLIHFYGWSSSWDRCVKEEFILPNTEENRNLQIRLASEAATFIKGKKKQPPVIKESLAKRAKENEQETSIPSPKIKSESSSESESSEDEGDKVVEISIPGPLRRILDQDWNYVTQKDKVIKLPCEQNVISILEGYVKYVATKLLNASPPKSSKTGKQVISENVESKINFHMEVMDGIRIYFDFTLPHLLLYRQEKKQYYTIGNTCSPLSKVKSECPRIIKKEILDTPLSLSPTVVLRKESTKLMPSPQFRTGHQLLTTSPKQQSANEDETSSPTSPKLRASSRTIHQSREAMHKCKKPRVMGSRQGLRSADKSKSVDEVCNSGLPHSPNTSDQEMDSSPPRPPPESPPSPPNSPSRQTRRSTLRSVTPQPALSPTGSSSARSPNNPGPIISSSIINFSNLPVVTMKPLPAISISNLSSSASSTHSSISCLKDEKPPVHLSKHFGLLKSVLEWKMIPEQFYMQSPPPPSLVYGAHHLLRLFIKLPELLYKTNMPRRKLQLLLESLDGFVKYLEQKKDELFLPSLYINSCSDSPDTHPVQPHSSTT